MKPLTNPLFVKFIVYFNNNQDFFECHEVLEDYWNTFPNRTKDHPLTAYILLSTGMYHWRRGNTIGALRTLKKADRRMAMLDTTSSFANGIDFNNLCIQLKKSIKLIEKEQSFRAFPIQILSSEIKQLVNDLAESLVLLPFGSDEVIHKHLLRDRTEVIRIRDEKKKGRH